MNICHYLFLIENNKITAVLNKGNNFEIIKFRGNNSVEYKDDFWEMWKEYAGFLKNDFTDFCFIFDDEMPCVSEYLKNRECPDNECIWDKYRIQSAIDSLDISRPLQIFNENGMRIAQTGSFRNIEDSDIIRLTAVYRNSEKNIIPDESEPTETTPFIEEMLEKLKMYDMED